ncbi:MAG: DUF167 domain-containing protein [Candidatus Auribacterota bacterium]|jgi:uncharacterized protein (TIGR00251 family)|nr:DUF167 domain-containing protein [Candidatus Auribacterota bacterium]
MDDRLVINQNDKGIFFEVKVLPRASFEQIVGCVNGQLKVKLTAPPVSGKANCALVALLAKKLGVPKNSISIVRGETSSHKQLCVHDPTQDVITKIQQLQ